MTGRWLVVYCLLLPVACLDAAELENNSFHKQATRYLIDVSVKADVPEAYARSVLADPDRMRGVNPSIQSIQYLPPHPNGARRFIDHTTICAFIFCMSYRNIMQLRVRAGGKIALRVEPRGSDFRYGRVVWRTESLGEGFSRLSFHAVIDPGFWLPPGLGTAILGSRLTEVVYDMVRRMECHYHGQETCKLYESDVTEDEREF